MRCHPVMILSLPLTIGGCAVSAPPVAPPPLTAPSIAAPPVAAPLMPTISPPPQPPKPTVYARASWYGREFAGRRTTSGETYNPGRLTAASVTLPLGSVVKVENPENGRSVSVRINDCGPLVRGRSLDLSRRAAQKIGITHRGVAHVKVTLIKIPSGADGDRCSR
jgi:rare lipoprotein A